MEQASNAARQMTKPRPTLNSVFILSQNGSVGFQGDLFEQPEPHDRLTCFKFNQHSHIHK